MHSAVICRDLRSPEQVSAQPEVACNTGQESITEAPASAGALG